MLQLGRPVKLSEEGDFNFTSFVVVSAVTLEDLIQSFEKERPKPS